MNQEIVDSISLLLGYTILISVGYSWQRHLQKLEQQKEKPKELETIKNNAQEDNPVDQPDLNSPKTSQGKQEQVGLLELYLYSYKQFKQNKQNIELIKIGQYILYISNNLMVVSIMNAYYGIEDFNKSSWILGLLIVPIYNLIQLIIFLFAYLLAYRILKKKLIENIDTKFILVGYFYFILGNLIIVSSISGDDYLFDKALSICAIQYILEIVLNKLIEKGDLDVVLKLDTILKKL
ncbi:unnamed protein product (macronuclear) [Paramecium tetraurelia]|uniref:Transmembrane protein n=1 Tax=Paramecium tetraurelia TaxID=5888 RepID=A0BNH9_PARTE|nr:uncharacterized protein GSPATT00030734001 [Paramecium tetraurelia]CAK60096.1 unnamed protein product [Paramecium tetraurelia]|eukprot:XP_001427494.1 hypothetical protein (macronuclear) [Paramecium tetraurelia strain d4-2]